MIKFHTGKIGYLHSGKQLFWMGTPGIRLKIDEKTIVSVRSIEMLNVWLEKFPDAQVLG